MRLALAGASTIRVLILALLGACQPDESSSGSAMTTETQAAAPTSTVTEPPPTTAPPSTTADGPAIIPGVASVPYEDRQLGFLLYRPENSSVLTQGFEGFLPLTQAPVVAITLPVELFEGTNLIEAGVYIGASSSPAVVSKWTSPWLILVKSPRGRSPSTGRCLPPSPRPVLPRGASTRRGCTECYATTDASKSSNSFTQET